MQYQSFHQYFGAMGTVRYLGYEHSSTEPRLAPKSLMCATVFFLQLLSQSTLTFSGGKESVELSLSGQGESRSLSGRKATGPTRGSAGFFLFLFFYKTQFRTSCTVYTTWRLIKYSDELAPRLRSSGVS